MSSYEPIPLPSGITDHSQVPRRVAYQANFVFFKAFAPILKPARYKGLKGGRGSGKSHTFAQLAVRDCMEIRGCRIVCIREFQKSLKQSAKRLIETKLSEFRLGAADGWKVWHDRIETPGDGVIEFIGMQDYNAENVKSLEGFDRAWVEEAQTLAERSLMLLRPTIRAPGSQLWFSWNPRLKSDPVDVLLGQGNPPTDSIVLHVNYDANPALPKPLLDEMEDCKRLTPELFDHIWKGGYVSVVQGAYYAKSINQAKDEGRIGHVAADPLMEIQTAWDIGGTGAKADATAIVVFQFVGREIRVLDYYEAKGQPLDAHVSWLRSKGYGNARCLLPHDGKAGDKVFSVSYESALRSAGFNNVQVIPNQGTGAALSRVEAGRRHFPAMWFNEETTGGLLGALGWYHERRDDHRLIGLGPEHDWSSHGADAFGLMAVCYDPPKQVNTRDKRRRHGAGGWMG